MKTMRMVPLILALLFTALIPYDTQALTVPPTDMFQLPWQLGEAWIAMDGFDNGTRRDKSSPHNYNMGGAVDFAPHVGMKIGEDTSNAWVTAAAAGTVYEISSCHVKIDHGNGWRTEYYHLGNVQVTKGAVVTRNQRLAIIDNNEKERVCVGNRWPGPHLHFVLRSNMRGATLAGWVINYDQTANVTAFSKNAQTLGLFQPLLNEMTVVIPTTVTPSITPTLSPTPTFTPTESPTPTFTPTESATPTFTPTGTLISPTPTFTPTEATITPTFTPPTPDFVFRVVTVANPVSIFAGETSQINVSLINVPSVGLTSAEITCVYDASVLEVSAITDGGLFGSDAATALNGPQNGQFIFAIAGSSGKRATLGGVAFAFSVKGLQAGQSAIECRARVSYGDGALIEIPHIPALVTVSPPIPVTGTINGSVACCKPVTLRLYDINNVEVAAAIANPGGSFSLTATAGAYVITARAGGFLSAQGSVVIVAGDVVTLPVAELPAGDIDGNDVIDQFDAMTIGMNYRLTAPSVADLNCDGIIDVLDLEALAANYRKSGALIWQ